MINLEEQDYLDLLSHILNRGDLKDDRTGVGTLSTFGRSLRFSLAQDKLPLLTTKKVFFKGVVEELLFFIRGERDTKKLEAKGVKIWKGNTSKEFLKKRGLDYEEGDMGPMYGVQWRDFGGESIRNRYKHDRDYFPTKCGVDQLQNAFDLIKNNPDSRRILVSAYNPQEGHLGVLEPCHMFFQFNVVGPYLDCVWYQRSVDSFLGLPFNIASYGLLTHIMAKATGLKARELIFMGGDTHLYSNHLKQAKEQISRTPKEWPTIQINKELSSIEDMENLSFEDFVVEGYDPAPAIKAEMAV